jgi:putrescine transport system permease protein
MMATSPLVVPELVAGLSLLLLFAWSEQSFGWPGRGWFAIVVAHTTLGAAYVTYIVRSRLENVPSTLREAALDLGARPSKVFFLVQLPIIAPSIVASWLVAFILSFDDVVLVSFLAGPGITTLPSLIFSSIRVGYTPEINAMATCITGVLSVLIVGAGYFLHQKDSP